MRHPIAPLLLGLVLAAGAACADSASRVAAPDNSSSNLRPSTGPSLGQGGSDKITICHAAGRAGTTKYVEITVSRSASYAHLDEHGTPRAGHEEDYIEPAGVEGCTVAGTLSKVLDRVFIMSGNEMLDDPTWRKGQPVAIPFGETRWLRYVVSYSLPGGLTGTVTENHDGVCATASVGIWCGFNTGGVFSWSASGTGSILVDIDLINQNGCGDGSFTNTAVMTLASGGSLTATAPTKLLLGCKP